jgi:predicted DNA-binding transcriptional regulator YafY
MDFDLRSYWENSAATFKSALPKYLATFRVAPSAFLRLRFAGRFARVGEVIETDTEGWHKVSVGFDVEEMACEYALGFGPNLEVLEPVSLREKVREMAKLVVEKYSKSSQ